MCSQHSGLTARTGRHNVCELSQAKLGRRVPAGFFVARWLIVQSAALRSR
jgi:hypothetical protein